LLCQGRKAGIKTPARGSGKVVAGSPINKALFCLLGRSLCLPLDYLAHNSSCEDHVRNVTKRNVRVRKDEERMNVRIHLLPQYEGCIQKPLARQLRSQRHKDRANHLFSLSVLVRWALL
jgi:hypothetical protein